MSSAIIEGLTGASRTSKRFFPMADVNEGRRRPGSSGQQRFVRSRARRHPIEETGDAADAAAAEHGKIGALDRAVDAVGAKPPAETDMIAVAIRLADQREPEIRKALLHACD